VTRGEMHILFKQKLDKTNSLNYPSFEPEEIDLWLNEAIKMYVKTRYGGNNLYGTAVEETQKRTDDLRELVLESTLTSSGNGSKPNSKYYPLPSDYWFSLSEEVDIEYNDCDGNTTTDRIRVKNIGSGAYSTMIKDPFNKPNKTRVLRLMSSDNIEVLADSETTLNSLYLRYIKAPLEVSSTVDCDLASHTHSEIVDKAVILAIETIESPRVQTQPMISGSTIE
jgi:hypothetical protein